MTLQTTKTDTHEITLSQGLSGSGHPLYIVFAKPTNGREGVHYFDTKAEALHWIKWAY